jgi:hypothetical protein
MNDHVNFSATITPAVSGANSNLLPNRPMRAVSVEIKCPAKAGRGGYKSLRKQHLKTVAGSNGIHYSPKWQDDVDKMA